MDNIKEKIFGLLVIIALGVIFIPMLFEERQEAAPAPSAKKQEPALEKPKQEVIILKEAPPKVEPVKEAPKIETIKKEVAQQEIVKKEEIKKEEIKKEEIKKELIAPVTPKKSASAVERKGWALQLGTFGDKDNAMRLVRQLKNAGYPAYTKPLRRNGQEFTVVYVGPYVRKSDPERMRRIIESSFQLSGTLIHYETQ
jgi:DedD protein